MNPIPRSRRTRTADRTRSGSWRRRTARRTSSRRCSPGAVDDQGVGVEQIVVEAAGAGNEVHVGVGRHVVHGLDIERLLAVPALGVAFVGVGERRGQILLVLPGAEPSVAGHPRELVGVVQHGRRRVGVDDRNRLSGACHARVGHVVGATDLLGRVAGDVPRPVKPVGRRLVGSDLRPVVGRRGPRHPVVRPRRRQRVARLHLVVAGVESGHRQHVAGHGAWDGGGGLRRPRRLASRVGVVRERDAERLARLRDRAGDRHVAAGPAGHARYREPGTCQPRLDGLDLGARGAEPSLRLRRRQIVTVGRARRVRHRGGVRRQSGRILPGQVDAQVDRAGGDGGGLMARSADRPVGVGAGDRRTAGSSHGAAGGDQATQDRRARHGACDPSVAMKHGHAAPFLRGLRYTIRSAPRPPGRAALDPFIHLDRSPCRPVVSACERLVRIGHSIWEAMSPVPRAPGSSRCGTAAPSLRDRRRCQRADSWRRLGSGHPSLGRCFVQALPVEWDVERWLRGSGSWR